MQQPIINARRSPNASIHLHPPRRFSLEIPPGGRGAYRLAQVDDYTGIRRRSFPWQPPVELSLRAALGAAEAPGTWGFGFWNAPVQFSVLPGRVDALPALPQAAWFFYASPSCHISFRDDLPGQGLLAQTFRSAPVPIWPFLPAAAGLPLLLVRPIARRVRHLIAARIVHESGCALHGIDPHREHAYRLQWTREEVTFQVDGETIHTSRTVPRGPLGLVIWIDNQFAAFRPDGSLGYGFLAAQSAQRLEIADLEINGRPVRVESLS